MGTIECLCGGGFFCYLCLRFYWKFSVSCASNSGWGELQEVGAFWQCPASHWELRGSPAAAAHVPLDITHIHLTQRSLRFKMQLHKGCSIPWGEDLQLIFTRCSDTLRNKHSIVEILLKLNWIGCHAICFSRGIVVNGIINKITLGGRVFSES